MRVLSQDEGPHGAISGPLEALRPVLEELSGAKVELGLVPVTNVYSTMMLDWRRGTGQYDATVGAAFFYGELISRRPDPRRSTTCWRAGSIPRWCYDAMPAAIRQLYTWDGKGYGVLNDADGQVLYYRRDVLSDPGWQAKFKEAVGYDLPVPPKTWQQVLDIARFFDGKNLDPNDCQPDHGMVMHLKPGEQGHFHFQSLAAAFAIDPAAKGDQAHNVFWFDPETMKPLINEPGPRRGPRACCWRWRRPARASSSAGGCRAPGDYFLRGKAVFMFTFGDLGPLCQDPAYSRVAASAASPCCRARPGTGTTAGAKWVEHAGAAAGRQHHRGLLAGPDLREREAARGGLRLPLADGDAARLAVERGARLDRRQPRLQATSSRPRAGPRSSPTTSRPAGTGPTSQDYLERLPCHLHRADDAALPADPRHPGLLVRARQRARRALGGRKTAAGRRSTTAAAAWEKITDRLGRRQQLEAYRAGDRLHARCRRLGLTADGGRQPALAMPTAASGTARSPTVCSRRVCSPGSKPPGSRHPRS